MKLRRDETLAQLRAKLVEAAEGDRMIAKAHRERFNKAVAERRKWLRHAAKASTAEDVAALSNFPSVPVKPQPDAPKVRQLVAFVQAVSDETIDVPVQGDISGCLRTDYLSDRRWRWRW